MRQKGGAIPGWGLGLLAPLPPQPPAGCSLNRRAGEHLSGPCLAPWHCHLTDGLQPVQVGASVFHHLYAQVVPLPVGGHTRSQLRKGGGTKGPPSRPPHGSLCPGL